MSSDPPQRRPSDYRPDLRPMLILIGLIVAVLLGWILLGPRILPPSDPSPSATGLDGRWTTTPAEPMGTTFEVDGATYALSGSSV